MYQETTREMTREETRSLGDKTGWMIRFVAPIGCFTFACVILAAAIAGGVTLVAWLTSTIPAPQTTYTFTLQTFWLTAAVLAACSVMLFTFGRGFGALGRTIRGGRGAPMTTVETRATWTTAIVIRGLKDRDFDDQFDVLLLRIEPDTVWITEPAKLALKPDHRDCPGGLRDVRHVGTTFDEIRVPLASLAPTDELFRAFDRRVGEQIAFDSMPDSVQAAFLDLR